MAKYKPGQSGNPNGRPKGSGVAGKLRKAIADQSPDIVEALIARAKDGDVYAARLLLDRICPPLKAQAQAVEVAGLSAGKLAERATAALDAAAKGEVSPDTAAALVTAVGTLARIAEVEDLEKRLQALERAQGAKQ